MKNLIILTGSFPYDGGEQFIEAEISYWENNGFDNVYILPAYCQGTLRSFPNNIILLNSYTNIFDKFISLFLALFSSLFLKEVKYIIQNEPQKLFRKIYIALRLVVVIFLNKIRIYRSIKELGGDIYVYSYWNDIATYSSILLKNSGYVRKVFSRAHRFDIYQEQRDFSYMPLKRQFVKDMDHVYCLSQNAVEYYVKTYGISNEQVSIGRLGVSYPLDIQEYLKEYNKIRILSISNCIPVKRIDKMIDSFICFAKKYPEILIEWTHIGDGVLFQDLNTQAKSFSNKMVNFRPKFIGSKANSEVLHILKTQQFDLFVNVSESEGIPVSIMEAMAHGIPSIAPNVGGIADLVNDENGFLMSDKAEQKEIIFGMEKLYFSDNIILLRQNARCWVKKNFNAERNYIEFVKDIKEKSI